MSRYIAVDLDSTLAYHLPELPLFPIGQPIPRMLNQVKYWLSKGIEVRILTARMSVPDNQKQEMKTKIQDWLESIGLPRLEVTNEKTFGMIELWDDRAIAVKPNEGIPLNQNGWK